MAEQKKEYKVLVWYRGCAEHCSGHPYTDENKQYTRTRADRLLAEAKNEYGSVRATLYLSGTKLRWWDKETTEYPWRIQGENLPRGRKSC